MVRASRYCDLSAARSPLPARALHDRREKAQHPLDRRQALAELHHPSLRAPDLAQRGAVILALHGLAAEDAPRHRVDLVTGLFGDIGQPVDDFLDEPRQNRLGRGTAMHGPRRLFREGRERAGRVMADRHQPLGHQHEGDRGALQPAAFGPRGQQHRHHRHAPLEVEPRRLLDLVLIRACRQRHAEPRRQPRQHVGSRRLQIDPDRRVPLVIGLRAAQPVRIVDVIGHRPAPSSLVPLRPRACFPKTAPGFARFAQTGPSAWPGGGPPASSFRKYSC